MMEVIRFTATEEQQHAMPVMSFGSLSRGSFLKGIPKCVYRGALKGSRRVSLRVGSIRVLYGYFSKLGSLLI